MPAIHRWRAGPRHYSDASRRSSWSRILCERIISWKVDRAGKSCGEWSRDCGARDVVTRRSRDHARAEACRYCWSKLLPFKERREGEHDRQKRPVDPLHDEVGHRPLDAVIAMWRAGVAGAGGRGKPAAEEFLVLLPGSRERTKHGISVGGRRARTSVVTVRHHQRRHRDCSERVVEHGPPACLGAPGLGRGEHNAGWADGPSKRAGIGYRYRARAGANKPDRKAVARSHFLHHGREVLRMLRGEK